MADEQNIPLSVLRSYSPHPDKLDLTGLTQDEITHGIKSSKLPDYIRYKQYLTDTNEAVAQLAEMIIQFAVNLGLDPDQTLDWARKLQQAVPQSEFDSWIATLLDGGPSIFMNTLSELKATYPNGAAGVALVRETDPAKIYIWNGSAWEYFGNYQGIEVADNSLTTVKFKDKSITRAKLDDDLADKLNEFIESRHGNVTLGSNILGMKQEINNLSSGLMKAATNLIDNTNVAKWFDGGGNTMALSKQDSTLVVTGKGTNPNVHLQQNIATISGLKKYYVKTRFLVESDKTETVSFLVPNAAKDYVISTDTDSQADKFTVGVWKEVSFIVDANVNLNRLAIIFRHANAADSMGAVVKVDPVVLIDITDLFGTGNEWNAPAMYNLLAKNDRMTFEKNARLNPRKVERFSFIKDFGAVGDGVTDDTEAIRRALDYGGIIIFTKGTYLVSGTMRIKDNTILNCRADNIKFKLADTYTLSPYAWRQDYIDYFPVFVTPRGTKNVEIYGLDLEGSQMWTDHIQVGLAIETAENVTVKYCKVNKINYHPENAPARPSGQWRQGWNMLVMRSEDVEVSNSEFEYGGYECFRVGDDSKNIKVHHNKLSYGWRTVFQILKGCENIEFSDNEVTQDDFGLYDTHAALTFHSTIDKPIKNVKILRNKINAKVYLDNPSGPVALSTVDKYSEDFTVEGNEIVSNGYAMLYNGGGFFKFKNNKIRAQTTALGVTNMGIRRIDISGNDIETTTNSCVSINSMSTAMRRVRIKDNDLKTASDKNAITFGGTADVISPMISGNIVEQSGNSVYLPNNVKKPIVTGNDFSGSSSRYIADTEGIYANNLD